MERYNNKRCNILLICYINSQLSCNKSKSINIAINQAPEGSVGSAHGLANYFFFNIMLGNRNIELLLNAIRSSNCLISKQIIYSVINCVQHFQGLTEYRLQTER